MIEGEAFSGFHHLKHLDLTGNRIRVLRSAALRGCLGLVSLTLADAGVRFVQKDALADLGLLKILDLGGNDLAVPESLQRLRPLRSLRTLRLSGNDLSNATRMNDPAAAFGLAAMPDLERLELEDCGLGGFNASIIADNRKLKHIRLGGNGIAHLSEGIFKNQARVYLLHYYSLADVISNAIISCLGVP